MYLLIDPRLLSQACLVGSHNNHGIISGYSLPAGQLVSTAENFATWGMNDACNYKASSLQICGQLSVYNTLSALVNLELGICHLQGVISVDSMAVLQTG